jgi:hypothetical protein
MSNTFISFTDKESTNVVTACLISSGLIPEIVDIKSELAVANVSAAAISFKN